jgi:vacuolar-type H+-ATPase subunit H
VVRVVPEAEMVEALLDEAKKLVEEGVESRLAHADANAEEIARATRQQLVEIQGDVNRVKDKRERVADVAKSE